MTIQQILQNGATVLQPTTIACAADQNIGWLEAELLLGYVLNKEKAWLVAHGEDPVTSSNKKRFLKLIHRRSTGEPIAYLTGTKEFYGRSFAVTKATLIPRPETEQIVDLLRPHLKDPSQALLWDVGTGSGAIAVTVANEYPGLDVIASDISRRALRVSEENAKQYDVTNSIHFIQGNLFSENIRERLEQKIQHKSQLIIVANLPYLPTGDVSQLAKDVVDFEPHTALFAGDDGLQLIRKLLKQIERWNKKRSYSDLLIALEFDPPQSRILASFVRDLFPGAAIDLFQDLAERPRWLLAHLHIRT